MIDFDLTTLLPLMEWRDYLDITVVAFLIYQVILLLKGSRALTVLIGVAALGLLYICSDLMGLYTTDWVLQNFFNPVFLMTFIVVIFQEDIRHALGELGARHILTRKGLSGGIVSEIVDACKDMAKTHTGALIVIERSTPLDDLIEREGVRIDARITCRLILNLFYNKAPLHDGAVIISHRRIAAAACILPLAEAKKATFGTRHRAAMGISAQSDAAVIVVSEERGEISLALQGTLRRNMTAEALGRRLTSLV